jgi:hypothetical protein
LLKAELEEETLTAEEERRRSRRRKSAAGRSRRGRRGERRGVCSTTSKRLLVQEKGFCGGAGGGKTNDGVLPVVAAVEGERKTEKQRESGRNREEADFLAYFGPDFLLFQAIKPASLYRRWKRVISSTPGKNFSH